MEQRTVRPRRFTASYRSAGIAKSSRSDPETCRITYAPGELAQCDLWFPEPKVTVAPGPGAGVASAGDGARLLPVHYRDDDPVASRRRHSVGHVGVDLPARAGAESGRVTTPAVAFAGTLATQIKLAPPRDPESKGLVERANGYLETSFLAPRRGF